MVVDRRWASKSRLRNVVFYSIAILLGSAIFIVSTLYYISIKKAVINFIKSDKVAYSSSYLAGKFKHEKDLLLLKSKRILDNYKLKRAFKTQNRDLVIKTMTGLWDMGDDRTVPSQTYLIREYKGDFVRYNDRAKYLDSSTKELLVKLKNQEKPIFSFAFSELGDLLLIGIFKWIHQQETFGYLKLSHNVNYILKDIKTDRNLECILYTKQPAVRIHSVKTGLDNGNSPLNAARVYSIGYNSFNTKLIAEANLSPLLNTHYSEKGRVEAVKLGRFKYLAFSHHLLDHEDKTIANILFFDSTRTHLLDVLAQLTQFFYVIIGFLIIGAIVFIMSIRLLKRRRVNLSSDFINSIKYYSIEQLTQGLAHELNTPLMSIIGFSGMIANRAKSDQIIIRWTDKVITSSYAMKNIISRLVNFSDNLYSPNKRKINIAKSIVEISELFKHDLYNKGIDLHLKDLSVGVPIIYADVKELERVFQNLLENAIDSFEKIVDSREKTLIFEITTSKDEVFVVVEDNANGMTEETKMHIFDPFYTTKEVGEGAGLGMSLVYNIIDSLGGRITLESELEKGSQFRIVFKKFQ